MDAQKRSPRLWMKGGTLPLQRDEGRGYLRLLDKYRTADRQQKWLNRKKSWSHDEDAAQGCFTLMGRRTAAQTKLLVEYEFSYVNSS